MAGLYLSGGEYELTSAIRQTHTTLCNVDHMVSVQCMSLTTNRTQANFEQNIAQCNKNGLICLNREQAGKQCDDYAVRFYCALDISSSYRSVPSCRNGWTQSSRIWTNQASLGAIMNEIEAQNKDVCSIEYVVGVRCHTLDDTEISQIDQSGFHPKLECTVDGGYK